MQLSFSTSAQLAAFPFKTRHIGHDVYDKQGELAYVCVSAGTGLAALAELTGGGGGGITETIWDPRVTPAGLHASSDDFTADTIGSGAWLDWDHGGIYSATVDTARRRLRLEGTGNASNTRGGVYKAVPSNTFAVACKVAFQGTLVNQNQVPTIGMSFLQDATVSTGDWLGLEIEKRGTSNSWPIEWHVATAYNNLGSSNSKDLFGQFTSLWLCSIVTIVPATSTTVLGHYSTDGEHFVQVASFNSAYAAQHMGLQLGVLPAATTKYAYVSDFRVFNGLTDIEDLENGGLIS